MIRCPSCGLAISDHANFCPECGNLVPRCPTCGRILQRRMRRCEFDGTLLRADLFPDTMPDDSRSSGHASGYSPERMESGRYRSRERETDRSREDEIPGYRSSGRQEFCTRCGQPCEAGETLCRDCRREDVRRRGSARSSRAGDRDAGHYSSHDPYDPYDAYGAGHDAGYADTGDAYGEDAYDEDAYDEDAYDEDAYEPKGAGHVLRWFSILLGILLVAALIAVAWNVRSLVVDSLSPRESVYAASSEVSDALPNVPIPTGENAAASSGSEDASDTSDAPEASETSETQDTQDTQDPVISFILNSDSRFYTEEEISDFDADMCRKACNGIYARCGRKFQTPEVQAYFEQFDWYEPTIEADAFSEDVLNVYQTANRDLITAHEHRMGYR